MWSLIGNYRIIIYEKMRNTIIKVHGCYASNKLSKKEYMYVLFSNRTHYKRSSIWDIILYMYQIFTIKQRIDKIFLLNILWIA